MKILVFSLVMSLLLTICFAEINMNIEFSFPKLNNELTNLELYDYNEDGSEEIFAIYNGDSFTWELVCYSATGDTLFTHAFNKENNSEKIRKFKILKNTNKILVVSVLNNNPSDNDLYCKLSVYDLNNFTITATITDHITDDISSSNVNVTSFALSDINEDKIIFACFDGNGLCANRMKKYLYTESGINYLEGYYKTCSNFIYDSSNNLFYSAEFHHDCVFHYFPGGYSTTDDYLHCEIRSYSNELISQINTIYEISGLMHSDSFGLFYVTDYPVEFKLIYEEFEYFNDYKIVFYRLVNGANAYLIFQGYFVCFSSDLSEILWEQNVADVSQNWEIDDINLSTLIILDQEEYFVNFKFNSEITLRNLENGEIILSDSSNVNPFIALTKSDSTIIFIEQIDDFYYAYSLNIILSNVDDVINNNTYAYKISNYPNPFNPTTTISFSIPEESNVELSIYNIKGQKIKTLANDRYSIGEHSIIWNGEDASGKKVSSGIYFYILITPNAYYTRKMLLLK